MADELIYIHEALAVLAGTSRMLADPRYTEASLQVIRECRQTVLADLRELGSDERLLVGPVGGSA